MFSKLGVLSLGKLLGKVKGIGYKLGLTEFKTEDVDLSKIPEVSQINLPAGYQYPHQKEEMDRTYVDEILPKIEKAKAATRRPLF